MSTRRAKQVNVVRHHHVAAHVPVRCLLPYRTEVGMNRFIRQQRPPVMGADREENDGRTISLLKGRQVDRAMPHRKRVAGIHATIELTSGRISMKNWPRMADLTTAGPVLRCSYSWRVELHLNRARSPMAIAADAEVRPPTILRILVGGGLSSASTEPDRPWRSRRTLRSALPQSFASWLVEG
jgi:hypothetical protein